MTDDSGRIDPEITETAAREHVRSYAESLLTIVERPERSDIEEQRLTLETALDHFDRVIQYGTTVAYRHRQWTETGGKIDEPLNSQDGGSIGPDLRALTEELAIDRLDPFDLDDLRAPLHNGDGIEAAIGAPDGLAATREAPRIQPPDRSLRFERWLLTEFGIIVSIPIRDSEIPVRRVLEATANHYETARTGDTIAVGQLSDALPMLESLYWIYMRLSLNKPLTAATDGEIGRTMVSLLAAITIGFDDG